MTPAEQRALRRAAVLILVSGLLRWAWSAKEAPPVLSAERLDEAPQLLAEAEALQAEEKARARPLEEGEKLDPNTADEVELDRLPGVGPVTAAAIVRSREEDGPFRAPEELTRVSGVGHSTLDRMRPHLALSGVRAGPVRPGRRPEAGPRPIDVNRAEEDELVTLPGIGPALAARIVEARRESPFRTVDDLVRVPGIGPATLERLRDRVVVR